MAVVGKWDRGTCQLGASGSQRAVGRHAATPRFVEGSIVRIFMENFL